MNKIGIVADSAADFPPQWYSQNDVVMVPIQVSARSRWLFKERVGANLAFARTRSQVSSKQGSVSARQRSAVSRRWSS